MNNPTPTGSATNRRSIRYPLIRLIVVTVLAGIGLALASDALLRIDSVRQDIRRMLTAAASAAATAASAAVVFHDAWAAADALRVIEGFPEIDAAAVYTGDGRRLATRGDERLLPATAQAPGGAEPEVAPLADTASLHLPVVVDGTPAGTVFVHARLDRYWAAYRTSVAIAILAGLIAGALALFLARRFLERIIDPVIRLADAASDARLQQDFRPRPIAAPDNEIGDLVRNFNSLLAEVDAGRATLQSHQEELERLVDLRTAELNAAKEAAEEANRAKSRFLAAASHDLRQPIQAINLFEHALGKTPMNDEQRRIAGYLSQSTRSLAEILDTLLDISRLDSGMVQAHPERVPATTLIHDVDAEFAPLALAKGLRFKLFFPRQATTLFTDPELLHCVLRNLIGNALKYTPAGGVLVGLRRRRGRALLQVWDTGIGIAPDHLPEIFDEYVQVGNPERDREKGLGLGLAIARRLVHVLGGRIGCHSRLGKGSLFELSIPLADEPDAHAGEAAPPLPAAAGRAGVLAGARVVVIEDDPLASKAMELALGAAGLRVTAFPCAEDALRDPDIEAADFYIADFRLPGLDGLQFLCAVGERSGRRLKAALLTGDTSDPTLAGAAAQWKILLKPVGVSELLAEIEAQLLGGATATMDSAGRPREKP